MMYTVLFFSLLIALIISVMTIMVTNKAYSRKWEDEENEKLKEF